MKCFYHSADLDGHCSGAIVRHVDPSTELYAINYGQDFPWGNIYSTDTVVMVDFALQPFSDMVRLARKCNLIWIDHHQTAIDEYDKSGLKLPGLRRIGIGACQLTWEYFQNMLVGNHIPKAVELLAEYDVWNHSNPMTLPFQYGMRLKDTWPDKSMDLWKSLFIGGQDVCEPIATAGSTILEYEQQTNAKFCKSYAFSTAIPAYPGTFDDVPPMLKAICINKGFTNSKVFDSVWNPNEYDLMITFCRLPLPKRQWTVSLYSDKPDVDCGQIAKNFGGGGHKGAAGFQCKELPFVH
jgi:uncharacterized protein